ncbi:hypothetical protein CDAR_103971 [Caerostris darwini]|uniref:Uncharacterized protein n=1 Tax=Caerostris darwini TaxID=1538125 RepID=A0AAV4SX01_9ARAC|nr:hypothetical protein CDAR_103971 [Caerostris darwini]
MSSPRRDDTPTMKTPKIKRRVGEGWNVSLRLFINLKVVSFYRLLAAVGDAFNAFCDLASFLAWKDRPRPRVLFAPGAAGRHYQPEDKVLGEIFSAISTDKRPVDMMVWE